MELGNFQQIELATIGRRKELFRVGVAMLFIVSIMIYVGVTSQNVPKAYLLVAAAVIGAYMAMNIGANDVANNVGPAVGSKTITLTGAIVIAAVFEAAGALIAGGEVVTTIKKGIIDPGTLTDQRAFVWLMMAALLAGAIWLNLATYMGWPVSTTHSIVGGVLGAGIAAGGFGIANWDRMGAIAASWVISPLLGGVIAAMFLYVIKRLVTYQRDMVAAARRVVPVLIAIMAWAFGTYIMLKGLKKIWKVDFLTAASIGLAIAAAVLLVVWPMIGRAAANVSASKESVNKLFVFPLICGAALLSFAHGANDVANAVGPLAAINEAVLGGGVAKRAAIPLWVMMVGAIGIALGLALYGPKLIRTVGSEITELDQSRAFCIALAAAITVIIASQLGLPVSSTHVAVGAVFGVGFLREIIKANYADALIEIRHHHVGAEDEVVEEFLKRFEEAPFQTKGQMLKDLKKQKLNAVGLTREERKELRRGYRKELVKRSMALKIASAWVITVPISAFMAMLIYYMIRGMLLP